MFTIKSVSEEGMQWGKEIFDWGYCPIGDTPTGRLAFWYRETEDKSKVWVDYGTVYVMNANGKTVAVYHLQFPDYIGDRPQAPNDQNSSSAMNEVVA